MRNKPNKPRKWLRPRATEREYEKMLDSVAVMVALAVSKHVLPLLGEPLTLHRQDAIEDIPESTGWFETLRQGFLRAAAEIRLEHILTRVRRFADEVSGFNKRQFHAVVRSAYGVDIFKSEPWLADVLKQWESENIKLIRSIPQQALERMHGKIVNAVRSGKLVRDIRDEIRAEYGVTKNRADLIANDQIGKLNGQLTQERQKGIGVKSYKWRGALDERERDAHVEREGKSFSWDKPPEDGHPGEPIRCRCSAEPELPDLEDVEGLQFPLDAAPARDDSLTQLRRRQQRREQSATGAA